MIKSTLDVFIFCFLCTVECKNSCLYDFVLYIYKYFCKTVELNCRHASKNVGLPSFVRNISSLILLISQPSEKLSVKWVEFMTEEPSHCSKKKGHE